MTKVQQKRDFVIGTRQVMRHLSEAEISRVIIAEDADIGIKSDLIKSCRENGIDYTKAPTMKELGQRYGVNIGTAVVGFLKAGE